MMSTKILHKRKRLKRHSGTQEEAGGLGEDRISRLPHDLLHHILTLLVPKEAVRTRVLSKTWTHLWTSIPILDFGDPPLLAPPPPPSRPATAHSKLWAATTKLFMNFIDNVLFNHQPNSPISKLCLYITHHSDTSRLHVWLSHLLNHKRLHHLSLTFHRYYQGPFAFPSSLFTCTSITVLKLVLVHELDLPSTTSIISFPSLKVLEFKYVIFNNEDHVEHFFSNCPVLEDLCLYKCKWTRMKTINISPPALKILSILEDPGIPSGHYFGLHYCRLQIFAPNINHLTFSLHLPKDFILCHLPFLDQACIHLFIEQDRYMKQTNVELQQFALKFLEPLSNAQQQIRIHRDIGQLLFLDTSLLPHLPTFGHLLSLTLDWASHDLSSTTLLNMLQTMPNLQALYIYDAICDFVDDDCAAVTSLPPCLLLHLRQIRIRKISGHEGELCMIEFFLKNAKALRRMIVTTDPTLQIENKNIISKRLRMIPMCSPKGCIEIDGVPLSP